MKILFLFILIEFMAHSSHGSFKTDSKDWFAQPLFQVLNDLESEMFLFKERGRAYGFYSTDSCLYVSKKILIQKDYCYPQKNYPAKSYSIISRKFGWVKVYQEKIG